MISLQETLKLNNQAVALFNSNEMTQAASQYYKSLCIARQLMNTIPQQTSCSGSINTNQSTNGKSGCFRASSRGSSSQKDTYDKYFLYQRAIIFEDANTSISARTLTVYCAGILFNTALLHHQSALASGRSCSLFRAEQLYEASLQLLGGMELSLFDKSIRFIAIASTNNLALIKFEKGLLPDASQNFHFLSSLLHGFYEDQDAMITAQEVQGFQSNSLMAI